MRSLFHNERRMRPVILVPFAAIGGVLLAYAWYLVIVGVILPLFTRLIGAD